MHINHQRHTTPPPPQPPSPPPTPPSLGNGKGIQNQTLDTPHKRRHITSSLAKATIEHDSGARGTTSAGGGRGVARDATPTPSVGAWAIKKGLCHSSSATAATKRNHDTRGLMSARGGQGAAHAATPTPSVGTWAMDTASATSPQQQLQPNVIAAPGEERAHGGAEGPPALQHQHHLSGCGPWTQPLPLLSDNRDRTQSRRWGNDECTGGGEGPPVPQRQDDQSTRGPSMQPLPLLLSNSHDQSQLRRRGNNKRGGGG